MLADEKHVLTILKTTMRVLGYSNRDVERRLELSGSYLSRLFSGEIDLRFSHIVNISRAMGLEPEEVLLLAYPPTPASKSEAARRLAASLERLEPKETPGELRRTRQEQQMEEAVEQVVASMLGKLGSGRLGSLPGTADGREPPPEPSPRSEPPRRQRQGRKAKS